MQNLQSDKNQNKSLRLILLSKSATGIWPSNMTYKKTTVKEIKRQGSLEESAGSPGNSAGNAQVSIPVVEERLNIDKQLVETGKFRIRKTVTEENVSETVPAYQENVRIERVELNQYVDAAPEVRTEGLTTIIPVVKEVLVVEKRLMLVEEIHVTRQGDEVNVEVKDRIRKEHVEITKKDPEVTGK